MKLDASDPRQAVVPAGDVGAGVRDLLLQHYARLLDYVRRHMPADLRPHLDAQDVLQDVWLEVFRRIGEFRAQDDSSAYRWLVTVTRHRLLKLLERHRAAKRGGGWTPLPAAAWGSDESAAAMLAELARYERTPSDSAMARELAAAIQQSIGRLPPEYGRAIRLRYMDRLGVPAIAAALERTEHAVHMVCNRAIKALRAEMGSASLYT